MKHDTGHLGQPIDANAAVIMIVDDEPVNIKVLRKYLASSGYGNFVTTSDSREALTLVHEHRPDVILLDVMMPDVDGLTILQSLRSNPRTRFTPVLIVTASNEAPIKLRALELGATDFLAKPIDSSDLLPRVRNAIMVKAYQDQLESYSTRLEKQVQRRTAKLEASRMHVIHCLARAAEYRDDTTGHHVIRVGLYAGVVARHLGLDEKTIDRLELAAQLHDVGKIGIPDAILRKPGKLTAEEFREMQEHCVMGRDIILAAPVTSTLDGQPDDQWKAMLADVADSPVLTLACRIAVTHHEKWNGAGYPMGLAGEEIPIEGRVVAIADVFDALSSKRPYKDAFPLEKCLVIIEEGRASHFDPDVVDAFRTGIEEILEIQRRYGNTTLHDESVRKDAA